jgi:hypothetical protein
MTLEALGWLYWAREDQLASAFRGDGRSDSDWGGGRGPEESEMSSDTPFGDHALTSSRSLDR